MAMFLSNGVAADSVWLSAWPLDDEVPSTAGHPPIVGPNSSFDTACVMATPGLGEPRDVIVSA